MTNPTSFFLGSKKNELINAPIAMGEIQRMDQMNSKVKEALQEIKLTHTYAMSCASFALSYVSKVIEKKIGATPIDLDFLSQEYLNKVETILNQFAQELTTILKVEPSHDILAQTLDEFAHKEDL
jgi:hypothetical protein